MKNLPTERFSANGIIIINMLVIVFHLMIITGVIPFGIVWGGRLKSHEEMLQFESISILINLLILFVVAIRIGYLRIDIPNTIIKGILWCMVVLFVLNTVGNMLAISIYEKVIFTPLTLLLAIFSFRLAVSSKQAVVE